MVRYCLVLWCLIMVLNSKCNGDSDVAERPYFRIVAPQFICSNLKTNMTEEESDKITISLQTQDGQSFRYVVAINFTIIGGYQNQKHTLSIWKNVRKLQDKFNKVDYKDITLKNQIVIDAKELTPFVVYTFRVVGVDDSNRTTDVQQFTVTFKGGTLQQVQANVEQDIEVSLLLLGTETFYDDMAYLSVAEAIFCIPSNDYFFKWTISNVATELAEILTNVKGGSLLVPKGALKARNSYEVSVALYLKDIETEIAKTSLNVKISTRDFIIQIAPARSTIGINKQQIYTVSLSSVDEQLSAIIITWECNQKDGPACENFVSNNSVNQMVDFSNEGSFVLTAKVQIGNMSKEAQTEIMVSAKIIPYVFIKSIPQQPINVKDDFQLDVTVVDLIPKCFVNWTVAAEDGFSTIDESILGDSGSIYVKDLEESFLNELVDFQNNTVTMDVTLKIPALWENWDGLVAGEKYKFRLSITCPEAFEEENKKSLSNITNTFDFDFSTNAPPIPLPLEVDPPNGTAMQTSFKLKTGAAKDFPQNFPLKYTFGYLVNNMTLMIATYYENTVTQEFELPLASEESPINTFYEVCDSNNACILVNGPNISTTKGNYSQEMIDFRMAKFRAEMDRATYNQASNTAVVMFLTLQDASPAYEEISKLILATLHDHLRKLETIKNQTLNKIQEQQIVDFIKISRFITFIIPSQTYDETFVSDLLNLASFIDDRDITRRKRAALVQNKDLVLLDMEYLKTVLSLSEILLNSRNVTIAQTERVKISHKIHKFVAKMCKDPNNNGQTIETKIANFDVVKILPRQIYFGQFPIGPSAFQILGSSSMSIKSLNSGQYLCMAKINYLFDVMETGAVSTDNQSEVYEVLLMQKNIDNSEYSVMDMSTLAEGITLNVKVDPEMELQCSAWTGKSYSTTHCKVSSTNSKKICNCKMNGELIIKTKIEPKNETPTTTEIWTTTDLITFAIPSSTTKPMKDEIYTVLPSGAPSKIPNSIPASALATSASIVNHQSTKDPLNHHLTFAQIAQSTVSVPKPTTPTTVHKTSSSTTLKPTTPHQQNTTTLTTSKQAPVKQTASFNNILAIVLGIIIALVVGLLLYRNRRRFMKTNSQQLVMQQRTASSGLNYARFHDEYNMTGDF